MDKSKITNITIGVLYKKSFRIMDRWGTIVDEILKEKPLFSPEYFPSISSHYTMQGQLSNPDEGHQLIITAENLIYRHVIQDDFDKEYEEFCNRITKYIIPKIIHRNNLDVMRLGVVYTYRLNEQEITKYISRFFKPEIKGITDFRFSRKEPTVTGGTISGKNDFINKIYTVGAVDDGDLGITYDYQLFYNPPQECVDDKIGKFLSNSKNAFNRDIEFEV